MARNYKTRKECLICKQIFYPKYSGTLYCSNCKKPVKAPEPVLKPRTKKTVFRAKHLKS